MSSKFQAGDLVKVERNPCEDPGPTRLALIIGIPDAGKLGFPYEGHEELCTIMLSGGPHNGLEYEEYAERLTKVSESNKYIPWLNAKNRMTWHIRNENKPPLVCVLKPDTHTWEKALCGEEVWYVKKKAKTHSELCEKDYVCKRCLRINK